MLDLVPVFEMPSGSGVAKPKGRPLSEAEFKRMLDATAEVVGEAAAPSWQMLMEGMWWSGLRLGEALSLTWEERPGGI